jgi:xanthine dehydrogenase YagR molybdenum-binding subunit
MQWPTNRRVIGTKVQRLDGPVKATGRAKYSYDMNRPGMLHAKILRCPHAHARIRSIDTSACEKTPGFRGLHQLVKPNEVLYFAGAEVIAIAADTEEHAEDCLRAIRIDYEELPFYVKESESLEANRNTTGGNRANNITPGAQAATDKFDTVAYQGVANRTGSSPSGTRTSRT